MLCCGKGERDLLIVLVDLAEEFGRHGGCRSLMFALNELVPFEEYRGLQLLSRLAVRC